MGDLGDVDELLAALPPAPSRRLLEGMSAAAAPALADLEADRAVQCLVDAAEAGTDDLDLHGADLHEMQLHGLELHGSSSPKVLVSPDTAAQLLEDMSSVLLDVQVATGRGGAAPTWHPPPGWQPGLREVPAAIVDSVECNHVL